MSYVLKKISENSYLIIGPNNSVIENHIGKEFPALSHNIATNLCGDLNDINKKNRDLIKLNANKDEKALLHMENEMLGKELRESFSYCVISTMMEAKGNNFELDVSTLVQWDRVFRLNPGPPHLLLELAILEKAKKHLSANWVNLQLNYSQSIAEMHNDEAEFVPDEIINELTEIVNSMSRVERCIVDLIYNFMDSFSITLPILWVAGKLNEDYLVDAYWIFVHGVNPEEMEEEDYEEVRFLKNRLLNLKTIKWGYMWNDETLPN